ncbi:MAG: TrkH family potassium uptake protein [Desulfarculus sp.]|nr:TrkH family potassium uptake protein [Pseudomonadota bacterium]MBV1739194.1 TrkH family potassium uptake protein [Desulfarculus sp.]
MNHKYFNKLRQASPAMLLLFSYGLVILLGTSLLLLPASTVSGGMGIIDALFTATSAVCVTGLIVVDTGSHFTLLGQTIILILIQLGGLGIMTISVSLFLFVGKRVPFKHRLAMQDVFAHTPRRDIYTLVKSVLIFTALAEVVGTALLFWHFQDHYPLWRAFYLAAFHSISAFCNAGFSLFSDSFISYRGSLALNLTICALIVLGGIGFPVVYELSSRLRKKGKARRISVHTKVVLITTAILIVVGALAFAFLEQERLNSSIISQGFWLPALFQSITARTAGFNTVDIASLGTSTLAVVVFLMFFGASPGSCGGGLKTTTLALLGLYALGRVRGGERVNVFKKTIPRETVTKAVSLFLLAVVLIALMLFAVLVAQEPRTGTAEVPRPFLAYLFEVVSAFGTVGLSMGVTSALTAPGKVLITILMLVGRLGVPAFTYLLLRGNGDRTVGFHYAEERVMLG